MEKISPLKIVSFLDRTCDTDTWNEVHVWIHASEENSTEFFRVKKLWMLRDSARHSGSEEVESFVRKINEQITLRSKTIRLRRIATIASSVVALLAIVLVIIGVQNFERRNAWHTIANTESGEIMHFQLEDGTKVVLNKGAELSYQNGYSDTKRNVKLKGEAYFDVVSDPLHPFTVMMDGVNLRVLGTSFNIKRGTTIEAVLEKGRIVLETAGGQLLTQLKPGQRAVVDASSKTLKSLEDVQTGPYTSWRYDYKVYEGISFPEIIKLIGQQHDVTVIYDPASFDHTKYRLVVGNESLDEMLKMLNLIMPIDYSIEGTHVMIKKK